MITPHSEYMRLGGTEEARLRQYRSIFSEAMSKDVLSQIRDSIQSGWVLGGERFREEVEVQLAQRVGPAPKGGERMSERYRQWIKLH